MLTFLLAFFLANNLKLCYNCIVGYKKITNLVKHYRLYVNEDNKKKYDTMYLNERIGSNGII